MRGNLPTRIIPRSSLTSTCRSIGQALELVPVPEHNACVMTMNYGRMTNWLADQAVAWHSSCCYIGSLLLTVLSFCHISASAITSIPTSNNNRTIHQNPNIMQTPRLLSRASALVTKPASLSFSRTFASSYILKQRVSDLIKHDHDELRTYKDNILNAKDDDERVRWQNQFTWELARHSIAEELVVYPAMEKNWYNLA